MFSSGVKTFIVISIFLFVEKVLLAPAAASFSAWLTVVLYFLMLVAFTLIIRLAFAHEIEGLKNRLTEDNATGHNLQSSLKACKNTVKAKEAELEGFHSDSMTFVLIVVAVVAGDYGLAKEKADIIRNSDMKTALNMLITHLAPKS